MLTLKQGSAISGADDDHDSGVDDSNDDGNDDDDDVEYERMCGC